MTLFYLSCGNVEFLSSFKFSRYGLIMDFGNADMHCWKLPLTVEFHPYQGDGTHVKSFILFALVNPKL